jgi:hypothetical protein
METENKHGKTETKLNLNLKVTKLPISMETEKTLGKIKKIMRISLAHGIDKSKKVTLVTLKMSNLNGEMLQKMVSFTRKMDLSAN